MTDTKFNIIYIMSFSRSGSTLLDIVLGNHPYMFSCGELMRLASHGWIKKEYCSCEKTVAQCALWSKVYAAWHEKTGLMPEDLERLQEKYERLRSLFSVLKNKIAPSEEFKTYQHATLSLFEAIHEITGKDNIIDSSKSPSRFFALSTIKQLKIKPIHLVRDSRAVSWSMAKSYEKNIKAGIENNMPAESVTKTAVMWLFYNLQASVTAGFASAQKPARIRYEDLTASPKETLAKACNYCECDPDALIKKIENNDPFTIEHVAAGNRLRMSKSINIKHDDEWEKNMPANFKQKAELITGLLLKKYGYK